LAIVGTGARPHAQIGGGAEGHQQHAGHHVENLDRDAARGLRDEAFEQVYPDDGDEDEMHD
jgi:hypothetical protein